MIISKNIQRDIQSLEFDMNKFTRKEALNWAKKHGYKHYTSRVEDKTVAIRQFHPSKIKKTLGTFKLGKHIKALYVVRDNNYKNKKYVKPIKVK